ncbi:unnamed protein product [Lathyrus sativus]|nr:unnamed protein product [Lathyrus sativus]
MEASGTVFRQLTCFSGAGSNANRRGVLPRRDVGRVRMSMGIDFRDESHLQYYQELKNRGPVKSNKKKLKLLKRLSENVSSFPQLGFAFDPNQPNLFDHLQQNLITDGGEELLRGLEKIRAEKKELKKKMKQEKKKAKLESSKKKTCDKSESSSSSSSESSDSDCDKVVDMNTFRGVGVDVATKPVDGLQLQTIIDVEASTPHHHVMDLCSTNDASVVGFKKKSNVIIPAAQKRIEVCMGNKCKKSGAAALLQEFEKVVGVEGVGSVVGCKCMGKCKSGPNVRIQNSVDHGMVLGVDDSVEVPSNPLCIGVGLEDVDTIVARFLGENHNGMSMAA